MYTEEFKSFVSEGIETNQYIGSGCPNSNILFVGKEPNYSNSESCNRHKDNASEWNKHILSNSQAKNSYPITEEHELRKNWWVRTWCKYQMLKNYIYNEEVRSYYVDFLEKIFTTEMNNSYSKNTVNADKSSLGTRKIFFKNSQFIQQFPVVVLACSNYIENKRKKEINDVFGVKYIGDEKGEYVKYSRGNWFYLHCNEDKTKLVIHTRQLSSNVNTQMLKDMGGIIREHLERNNLLF